MSKFKTYKQAAAEEKRYIRGRISGEIKSMKTPWNRLNKAGIDGLEWGTVNLIAAMSGVGKTALMNELVFSVHDLNQDQEIAVLFFTCEMPGRRLVSRMISHELSIPVKEIYKQPPEIQKRIEEEILPKHNERDIVYIEQIHTVEMIVEIIQKFCSNRLNQKKCLIIYDHSLLIRQVGNQNERTALVDLGKELLMLKKQFPDSQYMIISQMNRGIESTDRIRNKNMHFPMKSDIFGSDALWHASDVVLVMHDPSRLNISEYGPRKYPTKGLLYAHLLKVREGRTGFFVIKNHAHVNKFPECSRTDLTNYGFDMKSKK